LRELLAELRGRGVEISYFGVWNFVDHLGLSFKKIASMPASRIARTSPGAAGNGNNARPALTPGVSSSTTKPRRRPI
jgi:hypothetical protein